MKSNLMGFSCFWKTHHENFTRFSWCQFYEYSWPMKTPHNGEFLMAHEKFLTILITFSWYFYGP